MSMATASMNGGAQRIEYVRDGEIKEMVLTSSLHGRSILRDI